MGILDSFGKIIGTVDKATRTADKTMRTAEKVKDTAEKVGSALAKKCKHCGVPLKTDIEKKKEMCSKCAIERI
ncbi:MAG: hypothetical protein Q7S21_07675 [archaeon]|nr:hypothetical protein [archaeon]